MGGNRFFRSLRKKRPCTLISIRTWLTLLAQNHPMEPSVTLDIPIEVMRQTIDQLSISTWQTRGIKFLKNLYIGGFLKSFAQLKTEFDIPQKTLYQYIQIKHSLRNTSAHLQTIQTQAWVFLSSGNPQRKGITMFYNLFQQKQAFVKSSSHRQWEVDLQQSFTSTQWQTACKLTQKATKCSSLWEMSLKITVRWYYTPAVLTTFNPQLSNSCWRQCGMRGDLLHILWKCPKLKNYWEKVFQIISELTQSQISPNPALALLPLEADLVPSDMGHSVLNILLAARLLITRKWKSDIPPSITEVVDLTNLHCTYERMLASSLGCLCTYLDLWSLWLSWLSNTEWTSLT